MNLFNVGLGNNGGSMTLVRSANTLVNLGHEVIIVDGGKNKHTWTKLKAKHLIIRDTNQIPEADVIVATGMKSISSTNKSKIKNKFIWLRGWETWVFSEEKIINMLKNSSCIKIVNSICLQNKLNSFNINSEIIRPGYDFNEIYPLEIKKGKNIILGGLYSVPKHFTTKRTKWILEAVSSLKSDRILNVKLWMFGSPSDPKNNIIDKYFCQPDIQTKNKFYNKIDIWLSPNTLEGLHIVPAEAMLTGCPVIGTNSEMSGLQDYLIHNSTGLVSENDFDRFLANIIYLIQNKQKRLEMGRNARNKILGIGDRKTNMKKMISFIERNCK